jgi:hypothetical protein
MIGASNETGCTLIRSLRQRRKAALSILAGSCAAEQRDELATFQLVELHSIPASQGRIAGYRIGGE